MRETLKDIPSFKKWCNYCRRYGHSFAECRQKQHDNQNKPQKYKEPNKSIYQYMKKDQNSPNKNIYSNNSSGKPLPKAQIIQKINHLITLTTEVDHQIKKKTKPLTKSI